ncbi:MAG: sulfotransferase domain-containing protein [Candidatus Peribacteraceae bacterium]|nr:sulfotransferase domain-containing protein [Candidatus Peribacteraceae bacterium]
MVKVYIVGHPRSGNHYLLHLLDLNFKGKFRQRFTHRGSIPVAKKDIPKYKFLYIYRNFDDVARSIYKLGGRHGVPEDLPFEDFTDKVAKEWYIKNLKNTVKRIRFNGVRNSEKQENNRTGPVCPLNTTIRKFHKQSIQNWKDYATQYDNILLVKYEDLMEDFTSTMDKISMFLFGKSQPTYKNVERKVGIMVNGDNSIHHKSETK